MILSKYGCSLVQESKNSDTNKGSPGYDETLLLYVHAKQYETWVFCFLSSHIKGGLINCSKSC